MNWKVLAVISALICGYAHGAFSTTIVTKVNSMEGKIFVGKSDIRVGDAFEAFANKCKDVKGAILNKEGSGETCQKVKIGDASVTRVLPGRYALLRFDSTVKFDKGTRVIEKK